MGPRWLSLEGVLRGERHAAIAAVRRAFDEAGAILLDARFFSDLHGTFTLEVTGEELAALGTLLAATPLPLRPASEEALASAIRAGGPRIVTLAVTFADGDGSLAQEIPDVPG